MVVVYIIIWDSSSVCSQINISNSSIIGGHAELGGGVCFEMGIALKMDHTVRAWKDSERYNIHVKKLSEKRWTIWNCTIRNNFATTGGGIVLAILEFDYLAQVDFIDVRFMENTVTYDSSDHISIYNMLGSAGMVFVRLQKVYFGYGVTALQVSTLSTDIFSVREVEVCKCTFEVKASLPSSINLYSVNAHTATSEFRIIFRNMTFINTPIQVTRFRNVTFINSTFRDSSTHTSLAAISSEVRFQGNIVFKNNTGYNGGALALVGGSKMILMPQTVVLFVGNHATHAGGALMVYDESLLFIEYCFYHIESDLQIKDTRLIFENNTAEYAGDAIFGGSIQYCQQLELEVSHDDESGISYHWFQQQQNVSSLLFDIRQEGLSVMSSQPYRACLCENDMPNCSRVEVIKHVYPGDTIAVSAVVVGQLNGTVPGVVHADFVDSRQSSLSSFQTFQGTE